MASVLVEPDVDNQKAAAILEEKAIMIEEDHAQPTVFTAQSEPEVKMPLQSEMPSEADATLPVQSDKQQIELNWFVIIVKTFLSYIKECYWYVNWSNNKIISNIKRQEAMEIQ